MSELEEFRRQLVTLQDGLYQINESFSSLKRLYNEIKGRDKDGSE